MKKTMLIDSVKVPDLPPRLCSPTKLKSHSVNIDIPLKEFLEPFVRIDWESKKKNTLALQNTSARIWLISNWLNIKGQGQLKWATNMQSLHKHSRNCEASDPRDHVYAFLGLAHRPTISLLIIRGRIVSSTLLSMQRKPLSSMKSSSLSLSIYTAAVAN